MASRVRVVEGAEEKSKGTKKYKMVVTKSSQECKV